MCAYPSRYTSTNRNIKPIRPVKLIFGVKNFSLSVLGPKLFQVRIGPLCPSTPLPKALATLASCSSFLCNISSLHELLLARHSLTSQFSPLPASVPHASFLPASCLPPACLLPDPCLLLPASCLHSSLPCLCRPSTEGLDVYNKRF